MSIPSIGINNQSSYNINNIIFYICHGSKKEPGGGKTELGASLEHVLKFIKIQKIPNIFIKLYFALTEKDINIHKSSDCGIPSELIKEIKNLIVEKESQNIFIELKFDQNIVGEDNFIKDIKRNSLIYILAHGAVHSLHPTDLDKGFISFFSVSKNHTEKLKRIDYNKINESIDSLRSNETTNSLLFFVFCSCKNSLFYNKKTIPDNVLSLQLKACDNLSHGCGELACMFNIHDVINFYQSSIEPGYNHNSEWKKWEIIKSQEDNIILDYNFKLSNEDSVNYNVSNNSNGSVEFDYDDCGELPKDSCDSDKSCEWIDSKDKLKPLCFKKENPTCDLFTEIECNDYPTICSWTKITPRTNSPNSPNSNNMSWFGSEDKCLNKKEHKAYLKSLDSSKKANGKRKKKKVKIISKESKKSKESFKKKKKVKKSFKKKKK